MRIQHVITRLIIGGAQENTLLSVQGQSALGHQVQLVCGPTIGPEGTLVPEALASGVDYLEIPSLVRQLSPVKEIQAYFSLRKAIRNYKPDVVHTHSSKAGILARLAAWHERVPIVVHTIHGLPFHPYQSAVARRGYIAAETMAAKCCHHIACVADAMTEKAVAAGVAPPEKFTTVYSGMKTEPFLHFEGDRDELRSKWGFTPNDIVIGKIARLFELKGHEYLFDAFLRVKDDYPTLKLFLVGGGLYEPDFRLWAKEHNLENRVIFAGLVPHEHVASAIHAMDLVCHCSLREGLARVLPQALLAGKPTISFDIDGAKEVIRNGETGWLIRPKDVDGLTTAIAEVLSAPDHAQKLAEQGRLWCADRFSDMTMCKRLLELYESLLPKS